MPANENSSIETLETGSKTLPVLRPGDITPDLARRFEIACKNYFADKGVKDEDQVRRVLNTSFQDNRFLHWIECNRDDLEKLKFAEFMTTFRDEWLERDWARKLDSKLRVMRQNGRLFKEWYNNFYSQTLLLKGTSEEMSDKNVMKLVYSLMDAHLCSRADLEHIRTLTTLNDWVEALATEDRAICYELWDLSMDLLVYISCIPHVSYLTSCMTL
jgi:hypothetical protein